MIGIIQVTQKENDITLYFKIDSKDQIQIIETAVGRLFDYDNILREFSDVKRIFYNEILTILIFVEKVIIFNSNNYSPHLLKFLKINNSENCKEKLIELIHYLLQLDTTTIQLEDLKHEENKEVNNLLQNHNFEMEAIKKFTDFQIAKLCSGMEESQARQIFNIYNLNQSLSNIERSKGEKFVHSAYIKYGKDLLLKLLQLQQRPFKISNTERIFTIFDKHDKEDDPVIRLSWQNDEYFEFYLKKHRDSIMVKNSKEEIKGEFTRDGVCQIYDIENFNSTIILFAKLIDNPLQHLIYYGIQTGRCSFCNKELSDTSSLSNGYGKQCAINHGMPWNN